MGYRIQYGKTTKKERNALQHTSKKVVVTKWIAATSVLVAVVSLGRLGLLDFLIPGDKTVTKSAFNTLVEDVRGGENVRTAITAFCAEILDNAETEG